MTHPAPTGERPRSRDKGVMTPTDAEGADAGDESGKGQEDEKGHAAQGEGNLRPTLQLDELGRDHPARSWLYVRQ